MLKFVVSLLLIVEGISALNSCEDCGFDVPADFPENNEELQKICTPVIEKLECEIRNLENIETCEIPEEHRITGLQQGPKFLATIKDVCSEDTLLHGALVDNLKCMKDVIFDRERCPIDVVSQERVQHFVELLSEEGIITVTDDENETNQLHQCISYLNYLACYAQHLEKVCSVSAMSAFVEITMRAGGAAVAMDTCDESMKLLPAIIHLHKLEENVEEALKKRK